MEKQFKITRKIRILLWIFILGLVMSGITAFFGREGSRMLVELSHIFYPEASSWLVEVKNGILMTSSKYPFFLLGLDWLAFAHFAIAIFFLGPIVDPERNAWIVRAGMIICVAVIFTAFIFGSIREVPVYWRMVDASFGLLGFAPLFFANRLINKLETI